jgi:hypothetical protein
MAEASERTTKLDASFIDQIGAIVKETETKTGKKYELTIREFGKDALTVRSFRECGPFFARMSEEFKELMGEYATAKALDDKIEDLKYPATVTCRWCSAVSKRELDSVRSTLYVCPRGDKTNVGFEPNKWLFVEADFTSGLIVRTAVIGGKVIGEIRLMSPSF